ncbi:MAG: BatA domain-containing protein [Pseudarcicella sp.]|nr:BatA domain-containing protein [Pseudarcicella sp.]MBP6618623.1 BatA domain-containing protein [Leadbetterella sp.]
MHFLNPVFLWGLLATAIPVIIHLFNFRKTKKIYFSNVAFLKTVEASTSTFKKLKDRLIMLARIMAIAALVLAFAQPYFGENKNTIASNGLNTSIYIDNSMSMQQQNNKITHLAKAIKKTENLLNNFPQNSKFQLLSNDFSANESKIETKKEAVDRTTTLNYTHTTRNFEEILARQKNLIKKKTSQNKQNGYNFFWFSDFQKSTSGELSKIKIDPKDKLYIIPSEARSTQNIFVDSVWLSTPFVREMQQNVLNIKIQNSGNKSVENLQVKLWIDNMAVSSCFVNISPQSSAMATCRFTVSGKGYKKGKISFQDSPIVFDNDYFFVMNAATNLKIQHLYGEVLNQQYLKKIFTNDSIFNFKSNPTTNFNAGELKNNNLVILEQQASIDISLAKTLQDFVQNGGSLVIIPSEKSEIESYKSFVRSFNINNLEIKKSSQNEKIALAEPDKKNSFFNDIFENSTQNELTQMPQQTQTLSWNTAGDKLLKYRNSQYFLTNTQAGRGKVYLFASSINDANGDFGKNALIVPIFYKIAALSAIQEPMSYNFEHKNFKINVEKANNEATFELKSDKISFIPVQNFNDNTLNFEFPKANQLSENKKIEAGYYDVLLAGKIIKKLAFNHDKKESDLKFYSSEELKNIFENQKNIQVLNDTSENDFINNFKKENFGFPLWKYLIWAVLFFIAIEILLHKFLKS